MDIKRINQLPVADVLAENTNVLIEADGSTQRIPTDKIVPKGMVKTVNNTAPDENGNVNIATDNTLTQSGQAADAATVGEKVSQLSEEIAEQSWESIGSDHILIEWDGNVEGHTVVDANDALYVRVSDMVFTPEQCIGASVKCIDYGETMDVQIAQDSMFTDESGIILLNAGDIVVVPGDNLTTSELGGLVFPEAGVYFIGGSDEYYAISFTKEIITPLPEKYLPESWVITADCGESVEDLKNISANFTPSEFHEALSKGLAPNLMCVIHNVVPEEADVYYCCGLRGYDVARILGEGYNVAFTFMATWASAGLFDVFIYEAETTGEVTIEYTPPGGN